MAPMKPHRRTARARVARSKSQLGKYAPPSPTETSNLDPTDPNITDLENGGDGDDDFGFGIGLKLNKKDKRIVKHNTLLNRVRDGGIEKSSTVGRKRRRPGKKLVADLGGLEDALPDVDEDEDGEWEGISDEDDHAVAQTSGLKKRRKRMSGAGVAEGQKMKMKSLKHKPGAMKKKVAMEGTERERFGKNLAGLMAGKTVGEGGGPGQNDRWKALRGFIEGTLEKDTAFGGK